MAEIGLNARQMIVPKITKTATLTTIKEY